MTPRIVILGAGPTGLGAAHRLHERGHQAVRLFERHHYAGGLAASFTDPRGFVWDIGGHIQFSRYDTFNAMADDVMGDDLIRHVRQSHVRIGDAFVPYPLQRNLRYLPPDRVQSCVDGLLRAQAARGSDSPVSYRDWLLRTFGDELTALFFEPYAAKVWICPTTRMSCGWVSERVAEIDPARILASLAAEQDDVDWGPNATFRYPRVGGAGELWRRLAARLAPIVTFGKTCIAIDRMRRRVWFHDASSAEYDVLISTLPLDRLTQCLAWPDAAALAKRLLHTSVTVHGIGVRGEPLARLRDKMWIYFPDAAVPFYRCMIFSRLSPHNVPSGDAWSVMVESADMEGTARIPPSRTEVLRALVREGIVEDPARIVSTWTYRTPYGYPIPTIDRDELLGALLERLEAYGIYSRGRFGLWRYEVSNQDHSFMQGVEAADYLVDGSAERIAKNGKANSPPINPNTAPIAVATKILNGAPVTYT